MDIAILNIHARIKGTHFVCCGGGGGSAKRVYHTILFKYTAPTQRLKDIASVHFSTGSE